MGAQLLGLPEGEEEGDHEAALVGEVVEVEGIEALVGAAGEVVFREAEGASGLLRDGLSPLEIGDDFICHLAGELVEFLISVLRIDI